MVQNIVKNTMKHAITKFAKIEGTSPTAISLFIHTKSEDLTPSYFYALNGTPKKDKDGNLIDLSFGRDIMKYKADLMGQEYQASIYLANYFNGKSQLLECDARELYIAVSTPTEAVSDIEITLYRKGDAIEALSLDDILGGGDEEQPEQEAAPQTELEKHEE